MFRQILICTSLSILRRIYSYQHFIHLMSTRPNILPNPIEATRNMSIIFRCFSPASDNRHGEERRIKAIAPYIKNAAFAFCTCKNGATKEPRLRLQLQSDSIEKTAGQKKAASAFAAIKTAGQKKATVCACSHKNGRAEESRVCVCSHKNGRTKAKQKTTERAGTRHGTQN